jgi:hypothetical protein
MSKAAELSFRHTRNLLGGHQPNSWHHIPSSARSYRETTERARVLAAVRRGKRHDRLLGTFGWCTS